MGGVDYVINFKVEKEPDLKMALADQDEVENTTPLPAQAQNVYGSFKRTFLSNMITFNAQVLLAFFYCYGLYRQGKPDFASNGNGQQTFAFYYAGIAVQVLLAYRTRETKREEALYWKYMKQAISMQRKKSLQWEQHKSVQESSDFAHAAAPRDADVL